MNQPPFPRIAHIVQGAGISRSDRVLPIDQGRALLQAAVVVEEKLDGSNISLAIDGTEFSIGTRGGLDTMDRGAIKLRLRDWAWRHHDALRELLEEDEVLYGEWMGTPRGIAYSDLPDSMIVLDLWTPARGFAVVDERDLRCNATGLLLPPRVFEGVLGSLRRLEEIHGPSRFGATAAEGLVIRQEVDGKLVLRAKWVSPDYRRPTDEELRATR